MVAQVTTCDNAELRIPNPRSPGRLVVSRCSTKEYIVFIHFSTLSIPPYIQSNFIMISVTLTYRKLELL